MSIALPTPTGPYAIGNRHLFFNDTSRTDPYSGASSREVSATVWYPTTGTGSLAPYLSDVSATGTTMAGDDAVGFDGLFDYYFDQAATMYPEIHGLLTSAVENAPIRTDLGLLATVVLSPAFGTPGSFYSILAAELASNGFIVVVLSVTWESVCTETNTGVDGQSSSATTNATDLTARTGDITYILGQLATLPNGIGAQVNTAAIGAGGHSFGGYAAMEIAYSNLNVKAVAALDCTCGWSGTVSDPQNHGLPYGQPVLLMSSDPKLQNPVAANDPSWVAFEGQPHGPLCVAVVGGAIHYAFSDIGFVDPNTSTFCGTIAPSRVEKIVPAYVTSFFDAVLRGGPGTLLAGPQSAYPEVSYLATIP